MFCCLAMLIICKEMEQRMAFQVSLLAVCIRRGGLREESFSRLPCGELRLEAIWVSLYWDAIVGYWASGDVEFIVNFTTSIQISY